MNEPTVTLRIDLASVRRLEVNDGPWVVPGPATVYVVHDDTEPAIETFVIADGDVEIKALAL